MTINKSKAPSNSLLDFKNQQYDYVDSYQGVFSDPNGEIEPLDIIKAFFVSRPRWIDTLFYLRNRIVSVFGLKTTSGTERVIALKDINGEIGERIGFFKIYQMSNNEIILGEDDKHLDFRVSLFLDKSSDNSEKHLIVTTSVLFNNYLGRIYFILVKPFHKLMVPIMVREIIKEIDLR